MTELKDMGELEMILKDLVLDSKRGESLRLAHAVQANLVTGIQKDYGAVNDKGVKQGPFLVLYGASMPSILTEVGFISNPEEESLLSQPKYRQELARFILAGIKDYITNAKVAPTKSAKR
jgi:N-acetylmuramoyl-L-alanine amidase